MLIESVCHESRAIGSSPALKSSDPDGARQAIFEDLPLGEHGPLEAAAGSSAGRVDGHGLKAHWVCICKLQPTISLDNFLINHRAAIEERTTAELEDTEAGCVHE